MHDGYNETSKIQILSFWTQVHLPINPTSSKNRIPGKRIEGARFFDLENKFSDLKSDMPNTLPNQKDFQKESRALGINNDSNIVVYDNLGIYTSPRVRWMFKAMGHNNVAVLDGGLPEWVRNGYAIEDIEVAIYQAGNFTSDPVHDLKWDMHDVLQNIEAKTAIVVDARSAGRFNGTAPEPREGLRSGNIPHSLSLPWGAVQNKGKMKTKKELSAIFEDLEIDERPMVFTCGSGLTACIINLAAEIVLDNPMSIYDGSWTEWAQKQPNLIETKTG